jgi:RNA polymerase sigma-70 factor (ECF subfamily)
MEFMASTDFSPGGGSGDDLTPILEAASRGDESAWRALVDRYGGRVFALARSRCGSADVAEEITQSVFATLAGKLSAASGGYRERGRFESWLFRIAMNRVRDHVRRVKRSLTVNDGAALEREPAGEGPPRDGEASGAGEVGRLREAMAHLSEADREVIELRHHGGLSFQQMAELLDEPLGTLLARHHRALRKLREWLEGAGLGAEGST